MNRMPVLFVGHGSPMNAIEDNRFTAEWEALGERLPRPEAILSVSAHWFVPDLRVADSSAPKVIYDMYGFPDALYQVTYAAPGSPRFAGMTKEMLGEQARIDNSWGLDHGTWSVLCRMYPKAEIPVFQLSVDSRATARDAYAVGQKLSALRERGVLILGSGNIVHNLSRVDWAMEAGGYAWARSFDQYIKEGILAREPERAINYLRAGKSAELAFSARDHYAPLLCALGASAPADEITVFNEGCVFGSISMTSYLFEAP